MPCSHCGSDKVISRGYCSACYTRLRRSGSLERKNVPNTGKCFECDQPVMAKGLCSLHYSRQRHPLRNTWKSIRSRYPGETPKKWERFEAFLADVGEKPSDRQQLRRIDDSKPYSAKNVRWTEPVLNGKKDHFTPEERALYVREWTLNRKYNIGKIEYDAMLATQRGVCAICRCEECFINKRTGALQELSVDHCHSKLQVRGLLCVRCNRMLGYARDDIDVLRTAINYLEFYNSRVTADDPPEA